MFFVGLAALSAPEPCRALARGKYEAMSLWFRTPTLASDERIVWKAAANREQRRGRAVGGRLTLTNTRLAFMANRLEALLRGQDWAVANDNIVGVGGADPTPSGGQFSGGLRRRLRLSLVDGSEGFFVVADPDKAVAELSALLNPGRR